MNSLIFLAVLACPKTEIVNRSGLPFNNADLQVLKTAKHRCGQLYKASPCVKKFFKRTASDYSVICGKGKGA